MSIKQVKDAAYRRGIFFDGEKKFRNCTVGVAYEVFSPNGRGFFQADTLDGLYRHIMSFPVLKS